MKRIFLIASLIIVYKVQSQIINTESFRIVTDTTGWVGKAELNINYAKNIIRILQIQNNIHVQYKTEKHLFMFVNKIGFQSVDKSDFVNNGIQHFRYNYKFKPKVSLEFFLQNQYNAISKIKYRRLIGFGSRFKFGKSEKYKFYLGTLLMYEYENSDDAFNTIHKDWRNSSYFSFSLYFNKKTSLTSTTYYQPRLDLFTDYRILHQSYFKFEIAKNLSYKTSFSYTYDAFPVLGIPKEEISIANGIVYRFR